MAGAILLEQVTHRFPLPRENREFTAVERVSFEVGGGEFVSISLNTLDDHDLGTTELGYWDGRHDNWQAGMRPTPWPTNAASA